MYKGTTSFRARKLIIDSLDKTDFQSGDMLYRTLIGMEETIIEVEHHKVIYKDELFSLLEVIYNNVNNGNGVPILHFVLHGNQDRLVLTSGNIIDWEELAEAILKINIASANNLFISMAVCHGFFIAHTQSITHKRSAYFLILGREDKHTGGDFTNDYRKFYSTLATSSSFEKAMNAIDSNNRKEYKLYHCESLFRGVIKSGWKKGMYLDLQTLERKARLKAKREGKKILVPKSKIQSTVFDIMLSEMLKWRDSYFMIDLYPENDSRFISKSKLSRMITSYYQKDLKRK